MKEFFVSTDKSKLDLNVIHGFLSQTYWSPGILRERVAKAIQHSMCFGVYHRTSRGDRQIGFARVVTDFTSFAYMADVFILPEYRGRGLSKFLLENMMAHSELQALKNWFLGTRDAHALYEKFGFTPVKFPERQMQRHTSNADQIPV